MQTIDLELLQLDTKMYLDNLEEIIAKNYNSATFPNTSFPKDDWENLSKNGGILLSMIPKEYGGRDSHIELCEIIENTSKYNLPLAMYTMIITALFVRNVSKYGNKRLKDEVLPIFANESVIGGFALTEPHCGSNLAKMTTSYTETEDTYEIKGTKHWQAFSSTADWWLIAAKNHKNEKEFSYFIIKREEGWNCVQEYNALGLKAIDYGLSEVNVSIPKYRKLAITSEKLFGAIDMLCASRLSMSAMAFGSISRIYDDAKTFTKNRKMGNAFLFDVGYVKHKLQLIHANKTISEVLFLNLKYKNDFRKNLLGSFFEAQCIKVLATDKMLESALIYQQLCGGEGYRYDAQNNNAAYSLLDTRVYTVFDGTNDLLSQQITEYCIKESNSENILDFLKKFDKTKKGIIHLKFDLSFLNNNRTQEAKVMNGQVISRIFGLNCLEEATEYNQYASEYSEYKNTLEFMISDIKKIISEIEVLKNNCLNCV